MRRKVARMYKICSHWDRKTEPGWERAGQGDAPQSSHPAELSWRQLAPGETPGLGQARAGVPIWKVWRLCGEGGEHSSRAGSAWLEVGRPSVCIWAPGPTSSHPCSPSLTPCLTGSCISSVLAYPHFLPTP